MRDIEHLKNMLDRTRKEFSRKYCLHPKALSGCSKGIASAHSVQKSILKKHIAENGHVIHFTVTPQVEPLGLLVKPERIGVNKATTFYGFCSSHDAALFSPLESSVFDFAPRQIALLGYRAVCREVYQKDAEIAAADAARNYASVLPGMIGFRAKDERHKILKLARLNARQNLASAKTAYSSMLSEHGPVRYYAVKFSGQPKYFCSVAFQPEWDFEGRPLQVLDSIKDYKSICFSAWAAEESPIAVYCWHKSADEICVPFIESLRKIKPERLANRILSMAFEVSENVVFNEAWWNSISALDQQRIMDHVLSGGGSMDRSRACLIDDGLTALDNEVEKEYVHYEDAATPSSSS